MDPLERLQDRLDQLWSPVSHMHGVIDSDELRAAYNACIPKLSNYYTDMGHNRSLCDAIKSVHESKNFNTLSQAQKKIIENDLRDFHLAGVDLNEQDKKRFAELQTTSSKLTTKFSENVLDATQGWTLHVEDEKRLSGIPPHTVTQAKERADSKQKTGWIFSLEQPDYLAVIQFADDSNLRKNMYEAFVTRASDVGTNAKKWDNTQVMLDILNNLQDTSALLGFKNAAELSLARKMAKDTKQVLDFIHDLAHKARPFAVLEFDEIKQFALETDGIKTLNAWDIAYYSEKLRLKKFSITQEALRPYFPEDKVINGMFKVVSTLYNIQFEEIKTFQTWHKDLNKNFHVGYCVRH